MEIVRSASQLPVLGTMEPLPFSDGSAVFGVEASSFFGGGVRDGVGFAMQDPLPLEAVFPGWGSIEEQSLNIPVGTADSLPYSFATWGDISNMQRQVPAGGACLVTPTTGNIALPTTSPSMTPDIHSLAPCPQRSVALGMGTMPHVPVGAMTSGSRTGSVGGLSGGSVHPVHMLNSYPQSSLGLCADPISHTNTVASFPQSLPRSSAASADVVGSTVSLETSHLGRRSIGMRVPGAKVPTPSLQSNLQIEAGVRDQLKEALKQPWHAGARQSFNIFCDELVRHLSIEKRYGLAKFLRKRGNKLDISALKSRQAVHDRCAVAWSVLENESRIRMQNRRSKVHHDRSMPPPIGSGGNSLSDSVRQNAVSARGLSVTGGNQPAAATTAAAAVLTCSVGGITAPPASTLATEKSDESLLCSETLHLAAKHGMNIPLVECLVEMFAPHPGEFQQVVRAAGLTRLPKPAEKKNTVPGTKGYSAANLAELQALENMQRAHTRSPL